MKILAKLASIASMAAIAACGTASASPTGYVARPAVAYAMPTVPAGYGHVDVDCP